MHSGDSSATGTTSTGAPEPDDVSGFYRGFRAEINFIPLARYSLTRDATCKRIDRDAVRGGCPGHQDRDTKGNGPASAGLVL